MVCNQENLPDAQFCKKCGDTLAKQEIAATTNHSIGAITSNQIMEDSPLSLIGKIKTFLLANRYAKIIVGLVVVCLLSLVGFYMYLNLTNENTYVAKYAETSRKIVNANEVLTSNISSDKLKTNPLGATQQQLQQQKDELEELQKRFENKKGPEKYAEQHKYMMNLLQLETAIFQQTSLVLANPLNAEADNLLVTIKSNIEEAKSLASNVQNSYSAFSDSYQAAKAQLTNIDNL